MSKSPGSTLRRMIREGSHPEEAASAALLEALGDEILGAIERPAREWLYGLALHEARHLEGQAGNRRMKRVLSAGGLPVGSPRYEEVTRKLRQTFYHMPDGARVLWDDMSLDFLEAKIAEFRKQIGKLAEHAAILEAARDLLIERGAAKLRDIPDWPELVRKMVEGQRAA